MRNRVARAAALLSLALTTVLILRIIAIGKPGVFVVLAPALSGALLAIWRQGRAILIASALLTGATASVLLIGGIGLLYTPSIVLFVWGAISSEIPNASPSHTPSISPTRSEA